MGTRRVIRTIAADDPVVTRLSMVTHQISSGPESCLVVAFQGFRVAKDEGSDILGI
jgi:hypothetical protein